MLILALEAGCAEQPHAPAQHGEAFSSPVPDSVQQPASPSSAPPATPAPATLRLRLDEETVSSSGEPVTSLGDSGFTESLRSVLSQSTKEAYQLEVGDGTPYLNVVQLLVATTDEGWSRAMLIPAGHPVSLELGSPARAPSPHVLMYPQFVQVGVTSSPEGDAPAPGLVELPYPYGSNILDALFCKRRDCSELRLLAPPTMKFQRIAEALRAMAQASTRPLRVLLENEPAPDPGNPAIRFSGRFSLSGRLGIEAIHRVVGGAFAEFYDCYRRGLADDPTLRGDVVTQFTIGPDGRVRNVSPDGRDTTLDNDGVIDCMLRVHARLSFPKPSRGVVTVVYPMSFAPVGEP